jgi:hypothetical protein
MKSHLRLVEGYPTRSRRVETGALQLGAPAAIAFAAALMACGSVAVARLTQASVAAGAVMTVAVASVSVVLLLSLELFGWHRPPAVEGTRWLMTLACQVLAAALAAGLVHLALRGISVWKAISLVERPAQFVNDAIVASCVLCLIWGSALPRGGLRGLLVGWAFASLMIYAATASVWHVDPFPGTAVQRFVVSLVLADSVALLVFDVVRSVAVKRE